MAAVARTIALCPTSTGCQRSPTPAVDVTDAHEHTAADANWRPLILDPAFPEYVSGHSTFSAAAATVLTAFFGDNYTFSTTSTSLLVPSGRPAAGRSWTGSRCSASMISSTRSASARGGRRKPRPSIRSVHRRARACRIRWPRTTCS